MRRRHHPPLLILAALLAVMLSVGCQVAPRAGGAATVDDGGAGAQTEVTRPDDDAAAGDHVASGDADPDGTAARPPVTLPPSCAGLPLRRLAALVLVVGMPDVTDPADPLVAELSRLGVGGVFLTGYNVTSATQVGALVRALRTGPAPAPLITTDEERGRVSSFRTLLGSSSSPRTMAATLTPAQVRADGRRLGRSLADLDVDWDFAPLADVDDGPATGVIGDRAFGSMPDVAGRYAQAFARGLRDAGILATAKHFPGHGAVPAGIDPHSRKVLSTASPQQLRTRHLSPFERLIAGDVPVVMLSHVTYGHLDRRRPASMSPAAYRLLRDMGFDGVAITDSVGMGAVHRRWKFPAAAEQAIRAGADAVLATDGTQARRMRDRLVDAVRRGRLRRRRLDEAAARVLALRDHPHPCLR
ncbi:MAG TPA: glycoside hydrolase family 3 N-terminal domain-containing protein [Euzebyales bacterium]